MAKQVLGRGLSALISREGTERKEVVRELNVKDIMASKFQPRRDFDLKQLKELMASIREKGVVQPILVRPSGDKYELVAGERRWRAAKELGWKKIPAMLRDASDTEALELTLIENLQRQDLNPMEEAYAYQQLIQEFKLTQEKLSRQIGKERSSVANTLRLLKLPASVKEEISRGNLSAGQARPLLALKNQLKQEELGKKIVKTGLSAREVENLVQKILSPVRFQPRHFKKNVQLLEIEEKLRHIFGTQVRIKQKGNKGRIEIEFYSAEDLDRILEVVKTR